METKEVLIPAVGETNQEPGLSGEAVQVERLNFLNSEDPFGNPRLRSQGGKEIDVPLSTRHPVKQRFNGLEIRNENNAKAAGTVALLRVYDDAENLVRGGNRRTMTARAPAKINEYPHNKIQKLGPNQSEVEDLSNLDTFRRILGLTYSVKDDSLSSGYRVSVVLRILKDVDVPVAAQPLRSVGGVVGVGGRIQGNLAKNLVVPDDHKLQVFFQTWGNTGDGQVEFNVSGYEVTDKDSPIPPF